MITTGTVTSTDDDGDDDRHHRVVFFHALALISLFLVEPDTRGHPETEPLHVFVKDHRTSEHVVVVPDRPVRITNEILQFLHFGNVETLVSDQAHVRKRHFENHDPQVLEHEHCERDGVRRERAPCRRNQLE